MSPAPIHARMAARLLFEIAGNPRWPCNVRSIFDTSRPANDLAAVIFGRVALDFNRSELIAQASGGGIQRRESNGCDKI